MKIIQDKYQEKEKVFQLINQKIKIIQIMNYKIHNNN